MVDQIYSQNLSIYSNNFQINDIGAVDLMPETHAIADVLPQLNDSLFIPCLQRDYCWSQKQVEMLWD